MKSRLYNIYKGNSFGAGGTLSIFYGHTYKELDLADNYEDVQKFAGSNSAKIDHVFAFYYDKNGLSDITVKTRSHLKINK